MRLSDDEVIDRIRDTLSIWANEIPVPEPTLTPLVELTPTSVGHRRRHTGLLVAVAVTALATAAVVVAVRTDERARLVEVGSGPSSVTGIPIARSFGVRGLAVSDDSVWVTSQFDQELYRVDPSTNSVVETFPIPDHVEGVLAADGWLWLSRYEPNEVIRVDPASGALTTRLGFDSQPNVAVDGGRIWVVAERGGTSQALEIDPSTAMVVDEISLVQPAGPAIVSDRHLWVASSGATTVTSVDLAEHRVAAVVDVGGEPRSIVAAAGSIWVAVNVEGPNPTGSVVGIDPATGEVTASVTTGRWIHSLTASEGVIWATNFNDGTLSIVDARTAEVVATTPIGNRPGGVVIGHGSVWVTPHRRNLLLRIDPSVPLEAAAVPDLARSIDVGAGTVYVRCSGNGSPTVIIDGNTGEGAAWAVVEARLSRTTRVCVYEPVGIADPAEIGQAGPASTVADDLATALDAVREAGPFVVVGEWTGGLSAHVFASTHPDATAGLVLVHGLSADFFERLADVLPPDALERMRRSLRDDPGLQRLNDSLLEVAEISGLGDLPLVVVNDATADPAGIASGSDPLLTLAESEAVGTLLMATQRDLAAQSTAGRFVVTDGPITPADIIDAVVPLLGG